MATVEQVSKRVTALKEQVATLEKQVATLQEKFEEYLLKYTNLEQHFGKGFVAALLGK